MGSQRRRRQSTRKKTALEMAAGTVGLVQTTRERLNAVLTPVAWVSGVLGILGILGCAILWLLPVSSWPEGLVYEQLPLYGTSCLVAASLLGWGCMQGGLRKMRDVFGESLGGPLFVVLPVLCAVVGALAARKVLVLHDLPGYPWSELFVRFYPPLLMVAALGSFLAIKASKKQEGQLATGFWWALLILPYALLLGLLVFGLQAPFLSDSLRETMRGLGQWAIVLQVTLAYFLCAGGSSGG